MLETTDSSEATLIDKLLADQRELTAVARFSRQHERHEIPAQARYYRNLIPMTLPKKGEQYGFEVDLDQCSGCKACVTACHNLNGLAEDETWRSVGSLHGGTAAEPIQMTVTTACHHCIDPACLNGCPVLAYEKDSVTGIVHHLDDQCIGCSYCVMKCPYEVPQYHKKKGIVRKCDMCSSRLLSNEAPACVQACPNEAIRITLVGREQIAVETTSDTRLVPGAPDSDYTIPATRYLRADGFPANTQPADFARLKPAPAHPPLVFMLVLTQLSVGMFTLAWIGDLLSFTATTELKNIYYSTALLFGAVGLGASVLHLGRPLQAWRAFLGWRRSWLSREIILFGLFFQLAAIQTASFWIPIPAPGLLLQSAMVISGLIAVFCSVMVYVDTRRVCWSFPVTCGKFLGSTILLGLSASVAVSFVLKNPAPAFSVVGLILISAAKLIWEANSLASRPFSLTPCLSGVCKRREDENRFNGVPQTIETVKTVPTSAHGIRTPLKRGVHEGAFNMGSGIRPTFETKQSTAHEPPQGSRRREEAERTANHELPPPYVGGYGSGVQSANLGWEKSLLQSTVLRRTALARFFCGAFGGIILPTAILVFSTVPELNLSAVLAVAAFVLCLTGELLERHLFFTAVAAPKMPGGVSP